MCFFFFQAEDGIRDAQESRGLGDVYKRQLLLSQALRQLQHFVLETFHFLLEVDVIHLQQLHLLLSLNMIPLRFSTVILHCSQCGLGDHKLLAGSLMVALERIVLPSQLVIPLHLGLVRIGLNPGLSE
eukprot:TRINITY_DN46500_c0_g1_i1.p1 TRINITY_DN46500_c0_g1~~TRINITY_DN46500_c0_g1_i1.p1  ORF type:complete len:128 (+),score=31.82 TRINITY_DN46500_c0_g1_i1:91-474(+)